MIDPSQLNIPPSTNLRTSAEPPQDPPADEVKPKKKKLTKAEKKELKRQRDIEFKKTLMRSEFRRELELSRKTAKKLKNDWEESLREMKIVELKQELLVWQRKAMYQFNEKEEKIHNMLTLITNMEETNQLVAARKKENFNYIIKNFSSLTSSSKLLYEQLASDTIMEFGEALQNRSFYNDAWQLHCENIMHTTNVIFEQELINDYNIFVERRNDNVNIEIEKRYRIRDSIVKKMKASRQQLLNFVQQLTATNLDPHKYERIRQLMGRQRTFYIESQRLNDTESKQRQLLSDLQRESLQSEIRIQKKKNDLRLEQSYFMEIRRKFEKSIELDGMLTFEKLKVLSSESYVLIKHFEKLRDYGELLLSVAANVRKLQTEGEKVLVWGDFTPSENKTDIDELRKFVLTIINPHTHMDRNDEEFYNEMNLMRVFWRRIAIVATQNAMLMKEKLQLEEENKKYTDFIRTLNKPTDPEKLPDSLVISPVVTTMPQCPETNW